MRLLLWLLLSIAATAAPFGVVYDSAPLPSAQVDADMTAIAASGAGWVRILPDWTLLQPVAGPFDWSWSDTLVRSAHAHRLNIVYTLGYTPRWASMYRDDPDGEVWNHNRPRDVGVWSDYVTALARRYRKEVGWWQVWERPDIYRFRGSDQDLKALTLAADRSLHAVDPDARMLGPEVGRIDVGSINRMYEHGLATAFDILALYPDRKRPEDVIRPLDTVRQRIVQRKGPLKPVWYTGLSWSVEQPPGPAAVHVVSEEEQAHDLVRGVVLARAHGVDVIFWSAWRDRTDGSPADQERSGLERADGTPRPAAKAFQVLATTLGNQQFLRSQTSGPVFLVRFTDTLVAWTDQAPVPISLPPGCRVLSDDGRVLALTHLSGAPVYIRGPDLDAVQVEPSGDAAPDYHGAESVQFSMSQDAGLHLVGPPAIPDEQGGETCWRTDLAHQRYQMLFDVDDSFLYFIDGRYRVDIDVEVWGNTGSAPIGFNIGYDGSDGFSFTPWQWIDAGPGWKHYHFRLDDAEFSDPDSDFRINALGSKGDIDVRSVTVRRLAP